MLVLGVDPGSRVTGYGLIEKTQRKATCIQCGQITPPARMPFFQRIHHIFQSMVDLMEHFRPQELAIEDIFYAKNVKSSLKLGHARGAVLVAAVQNELKIFEYSPLEIKKAVAGYGRATKEQVREMVRVILALNAHPGLDVSDALAAAICHIHWRRFETGAGRPLER